MSLLVIGSYNLDLVYRCAAFPKPGQTILGSFRSGPGGKGSNQAVAAARAGAAVRFVGAVGRDAFAATARETLGGEGIAHRLVEVEAPTGSAAILLDAQGENQIIVDLGANCHLRPEHLQPSDFTGVRVVVCQQEIPGETVLAALKQAQASGALTVLNPAPMDVGWARAAMPYCDVFIPNETEYLAFTEVGSATLALDDQPALHRRLRTLGPRCVIVTLGGRGCFVSTPERYALIPVFSVPQVVDTVGAGDAFVGGFATGWAETGDFFAAARLGSAVAALSVTRAGAAPAMPHRVEVDALLRRENTATRPVSD